MVVSCLSPHAEELKRIKAQLGNVRKRLKRARLISHAPVSCPDSCADQEHVGEFLFGPGSRRVLATFILSDFNVALAVEHWSQLNHVDVRDIAPLAEAVERAYISAPVDYLVGIAEHPESRAHRQDLTTAAAFVAKCKLFRWIQRQNDIGVAPTRSLLMSAYLREVRELPADLPRRIRSDLSSLVRRTARYQRKWLRRFRQQFHLRLGQLPTRETVFLVLKICGLFSDPV